MEQLVSIDDGGARTDIRVTDAGKLCRTQIPTTRRCSPMFFGDLIKLPKLLCEHAATVSRLSTIDHLCQPTTPSTLAQIERMGLCRQLRSTESLAVSKPLQDIRRLS